ncbi:MAG: uroporphyrinogen decarboxylase [Deinococcus-Thermus bacterium]|jgi:uroporphyrinogen decarboxylase|nr:uroporphyrinogen decarboxylase [Deinococcota bacterium]
MDDATTAAKTAGGAPGGAGSGAVPCRFLDVLAGRPVDRPPFWYMRQAGRYLPEYRAVRAEAGSFLDLCFDPARACEVTLQPLRRYGMDAAILFSDILVIPHALGQPLAYVEGEGPKLDPVVDAAALGRLDAGRLHDVLGPVYETVERVRAGLPDGTALIGFAGAPWTVATYMVEGGGSRDFPATKRFAYGDPEGFQRLIDLLVSSTIDYLDRQIAAGAQAVQIFDTWAGALPESGFERWVIAPAKAIVAELKRRHPTTPVIGFPRGAGVLYGRYAAQTGIDALGLDTAVPPGWAAEALQPHVVVQGNLDPVMLVAGGDAMLAEAERIRGALAGGRHIVNLGHGILQQTPPDHVAALSERLRQPIAR